MKAGHELDALIAEKVMGAYWTERENVCRILWNADGVEMIMEEWYEKDWVPSTAPLPCYSTQIADAWLVLEAITDAEFAVSRDVAGTNHMVSIDGVNYWEEQAATAPLAICLAALKAIEC